MLEDLGVDVDQYLLDKGYTATQMQQAIDESRALEVAQRRSKAPVIGKFYGSVSDAQEAFQRFIAFNSYQIQSTYERGWKLIMKDGTQYYFRAIEEYTDVYRIAGICFHSVDVDRRISDERTLNYILSCVRWPY
jgi:hypothetical protein